MSVTVSVGDIYALCVVGTALPFPLVFERVSMVYIRVLWDSDTGLIFRPAIEANEPVSGTTKTKRTK